MTVPGGESLFMRVSHNSTQNSKPPSPSRAGRLDFGERLRSLRKGRGWTLDQLGRRSGVAISTISKAERGVISLTYDNILKLAFAFDMQMSELLSEPQASERPQMVTVERRGHAQVIENNYYVMHMLCSGRARKRMVPVFATIKAHSVEEFSKYISHPGEEFVYVLEGNLTFQVEGDAPYVLSQGDCLYFDSDLGHAYLSSGDSETKLLVVCWHPTSSEIDDMGLGARAL
ncbi:helix-turn-helix domain-containing protein [Vineibacter terrae]|nr:XRE family transcriptional regulator [Vineibacter terrae]